jgi:tRNA nucleotidyltransferase (CCA-adding enzyme)
MARLPLPGSELTAEPGRGQLIAHDGDSPLAARIPAPVREIMATLERDGRAGWLVGGSLRDLLLGRIPHDWDLATDARPEQIQALFPAARYENAFGTVALERDGVEYQVTTFRRDHDYADFRRPHRVEFGTTIQEDLARRDFTVNALAWGGVPEASPSLVDPFGGRADLDRRRLVAVGVADDRFGEDALRMIRAVRLAAQLEFEIAPPTLAAITRHVELVRHLSGERIAGELERLLATQRPSLGLRLLEATGLLRQVSAELADQRGVAQAKISGEDLWDHTVRAVDAVPAHLGVVRLAALVHDIGKPATASDGHFIGHDAVGADLAEALLGRLHFPRRSIERVVLLVRNHMFNYESSWSDTAVRRLIGRLGRTALAELIALRRADNLGSGLAADAGDLDELEARIAEQLRAQAVLDRSGLAIDGDDLIRELGIAQGPALGLILDRLVEVVINDPEQNDGPALLLRAQAMLSEDR